MSEAKNLTKNLKYTMLSEAILAVLKFVTRWIFIFFLGKEYLGLSGLFTDILSMLSLAELGFGISVTYSLYRPAAQGDTELMKSLVQLYRRVYQIVSVVVLAAGLALVPFLDFFIKEIPEGIAHIHLIYILNVVNVSVSYLFTYKSTILFVYQKKYIDGMIRAGVALAAVAVQTAVLWKTGNYLYYLYISITATLVQNMAISRRADGLYPYLNEKKIKPLPDYILQDIRGNVRAMMLHRVGTVAVFSTDNILISKFVGLATVGLYSNYMLIRGFLNVMINALFQTITPLMGKLNATAAMEHRREAFGILDFFSAWLFGWMSICLLWLYDPFIHIWLGEDYLLPKTVVLMIVVNFYVSSMRIPVSNTRSTIGLFRDNRYQSILEAVLNLGISVILAQQWGITGILAGTLISTLALAFWAEPLGLYRYGFKQSASVFFIRYFFYFIVTVAACALTGFFCGMTDESFLGFLMKILFCMVIPNGVYLAVYRRTREFRFLKDMAKGIVIRLFADGG